MSRAIITFKVNINKQTSYNLYYTMERILTVENISHLMNIEDYRTLLKRAKGMLETNVENRERFVLPPIDFFIEGKNTVIKNFGDIADKMRRSPKDIAIYLQKEMGTASVVEDKRLTLKSKFYKHQIEEKINDYLELFVICHECKKPDTHIEKDGKVHILVCEACGARRPLYGGKKSSENERIVIEVGKVYPLTIVSKDKNGYGIAKISNYTVYVAGTIRKNNSVNVKIEKVVGTDAFGHTI